MLKMKENNIVFEKLNEEIIELELKMQLLELLEIDISTMSVSEKLGNLV